MPRVIIRSRRARIATIAAWIAVAVIVGAVAWRDTTVSALAAAGWMGALGWAITMMWWLPELELNQDAVVVRNAWCTHLIDWRQITRLSGRWGVELILSDNSSVQASAAPRVGGIAAGARQIAENRAKEAKRIIHHGVDPRLVEPGSATQYTSLDAANAIELLRAYQAQLHEEKKHSGLKTNPPKPPYSHQWRKGTIIGTLVAALALVIAIAL